MAQHTAEWAYLAEESSSTSVVWCCTVCGARVGLVREGSGPGEPTASETSYPENIAEYANKDCLP